MEPVLRTALECQICVEIPPGEIYQCLNGHSFCVTCSTKVDKCPVCKVNLFGQKVRNRAMEELIGCTKIPCKYKGEGCGKSVFRKDSEAHFQSCEFRPFLLCQKLGSNCCPYGSSKASELFNHFAKEHKVPVRRVQVKKTVRAKIEMRDLMDILKTSPLGTIFTHNLFQLNNSARFFMCIRYDRSGDSAFMVLYMGDKTVTTDDDVSPFLVELKVEAKISQEEERKWIWNGRPLHYTKVDQVMKSPPLKVCLEHLLERGVVPGLELTFYEK